MKTERITIRITPYIDLKLTEIARLTGVPRSTVASAGLLRFVEQAEEKLTNAQPGQTCTAGGLDDSRGEVLPGMQDDLS